MKKYAVLSLDFEDWYHLDYLKNTSKSDREYSMLDGFDNFQQLITDNKLPASFFILSSIVQKFAKKVSNEVLLSSDFNSHGIKHIKPLNLNEKEFIKEIKISKNDIEQSLSIKTNGFRAPCFNLNDSYLKLLIESGYNFDSSKIQFKKHPLYGSISTKEFTKCESNIFKSKNNFFEFEIPTQNFLGQNLPISGGGYLRIFPLFFIKYLINQFIKKNNCFFFYLHPFELSKKFEPQFLKKQKYIIKTRFNLGRQTSMSKLNYLINFLKKEKFEFVNFSSLMNEYINE